MPIRRYKPTSPGRRFMSVSTFEEITKSKPEKSLLEPVTKKGGTLAAAANRRIAASSVAPVASGHERSLRPCAAWFSPIQRTNRTRGNH